MSRRRHGRRNGLIALVVVMVFLALFFAPILTTKVDLSPEQLANGTACLDLNDGICVSFSTHLDYVQQSSTAVGDNGEVWIKASPFFIIFQIGGIELSSHYFILT
jgi:hypothetical protein